MKPLTSFLRDCLWLLWMVFFRPNSLRQEVEQFSRQRGWQLVLVSTTVSPFVLTTLTGLLLEAAGIPFDFAKSLSGIALGVPLTVVFTVGFGEIGRSITDGVGAGMAGGVAFGVALGIGAASTAFAVGIGVALGMLFGLAVSWTYGVKAGMAEVIFGGMWFLVIGNVLLGWYLGIRAFSVAFLVCYFRLFLLPIEVLTTLWALLQARWQPHKTAQFLGYSLAYWDEVMLLPQPFLTRLLVLVGEQDRDALLQAAAHLTTNTFQRRAAINALLELTRRDLLHCRTLSEIAQVQQSLGWLTPHLGIPIVVNVAEHLSVGESVSLMVQDKVAEKGNPSVTPTRQGTETLIRKRSLGIVFPTRVPPFV